MFLLVPVLLPIVGGLLMIISPIRDDGKRAVYTEIVAVVTSCLVWYALFAADRSAAYVYSFTSDFSIVFRIDGMASLFAGMISVMWPLVLLYAYEYMEHEQRKNVFFAFYIMTYGVTLGVAFSANIITMYVFFEMLTLVTIPLVTHLGDRESMYAGRKYAAYTIGGASLGFMAVVLTTVYGNGGTFAYGGILSGSYDVHMMRIAFLFGFFGFGAKAAVFPLFDWLPTAGVAPTPVTALLHAVAVVNSGVFAVTRLTWFVFGIDLLKGTGIQNFCILIAAFSLLFGAVMALRERHFKRRLAYSTMSNLSYMLLGIMIMSPAGLIGGLAHMLFHGIIKMSLFLCAGAFMHRTGNSYIYEINGVGRRMPVTFACYTIGALSLTGIPLFCGFISKWQLLTAAVSGDTVFSIIGACALIASAFLCAMYTLTVSVRAFFPSVGDDRYGEGSTVKEAGVLMLIPIIFFSIVNIGFGVCSGPVMSFIQKIAVGLL